ncbi:PilZ domain-containing protein [Nitrosophilus labii]|uniref:PilZ domain-containing protein n=1 Tax=Nitrosophilus labii TaxID=2706014 RepID=UPI001656C17B|nr:PilZ domain-containing protein [Nitrosophilus labii]
MDRNKIEKILKEIQLTENEKDLLRKIFSQYDIEIKNISEFENSVADWLKQHIEGLTYQEKNLLNNIREKLNFYDTKYALSNTKHIKDREKAVVISKNNIPISLQRNSESKLFWYIDCNQVKYLNEGEKIEIGFSRSEDKRFYKFNTKIISIDFSESGCIITTEHSTSLSYKETRGHERYKTNLKAKLTYKTQKGFVSSFNCVVENISLDGVKVTTNEKNIDIDRNKTVTLNILFDNEFKSTEAKIKYILQDDSYQIGLEFINMPECFLKKVKKY